MSNTSGRTALESAMAISTIVANATDLNEALQNIQSTAASCEAGSECALLFREFVRQQMENVRALDALRQRNSGLWHAVQGVRNEIETRKCLDRARGILARKHAIAEQDAEAMLRRQSRQSGRSLREVAENIVNADKSTRVVRGPLARRTA